MNKYFLALIILLTLSTVPAPAQTNVVKTSTNKFKPYVPKAAVPVKLGEPKQIRISSVDGVLATYCKCSTSIGSVYLAGLPGNIKAAQDKVIRLTAFTTREEAALKEAWRVLKREQAIAPSSASAAAPDAYNWIGRLNVRQNKLEEREGDLATSQRELTAAREDFAASATLYAVATGRVYGSIPIWQVVPAPVKSPSK